MNRLVITDSGLGGLSVVAGIFEKLKNRRLNIALDLIFVNALPETGKGYNKMPDITSKIHVFNEVLTGIDKHFEPQLIGIACNTLSVITDQTDYYHHHKDQLLGIVDSGVKSFLNSKQINLSYYVIVFGTETTIELDTHRRLMTDAGLSEDAIIPQVCSGLASAIEDNPQSPETRRIIEESVKEALNKCESPVKQIYAYLACTHYGYVRNIFEESIKKEGFTNCEAFDPNQSMVEKIIDLLKLPSPATFSTESMIRLSIYSRCTILEQEVKSIAKLIQKYSPVAARALLDYKKDPDLF
ncbi:MAG: aspartate/glutamate racemase family protein [Calditrichia bacterium]|nr:aspartate/glutamate racemase family protein [Calditrichia bacterium]